jgi:hypothetical protein
LQIFLFQWTTEHDKAYRIWANKFERNTDKTAEEIQESDAPETGKADLDDLANHLSAVLNHPQTPEKLYNKIGDYLADGVHLRCDEPNFIKAAIVGLNAEESRESAPSDLSEMSTDFLKTNDTQAEFKHFAECLSEILKSPNTPKSLYDAIANGLEEVFNEDIDQTEFVEERASPEYIERLFNAAVRKQND